MSQQTLDLRGSFQIVRRRRKLFGAFVALGLLGGIAFAVLEPPTLTSTALVVLPQSYAPLSQSATSGSSAGDVIATQVVIATSDAVLARALPHVSPAMSLQTLVTKVKVDNLAGSILSFSASGQTAEQAEATANAVASSYIAYVDSPNSPVGNVSAKVLESATIARGSKLPTQIAIFGLLGAIIGALIGFIVSLATGRNDRRLVERDAIANSIAAPVLAAIPAARPADAASWVKLMEQYEPEVVHAWALNKLLQRFGVTDFRADSGADAHSFSVTVLSLSADSGALALGPQMAAFAASLGIPTALVIGPQQDTNVTATLRTACGAAAQSAAGSGKPLHFVVSDDDQFSRVRDTFVVVVAVIDETEPHIPPTMRTDATVLAVSAGAATAVQLARAVTAAAADGRDVIGLLVANPEPTDQTSGRLPRLEPPLRRPLPTRTQGIPMGSKR